MASGGMNNQLREAIERYIKFSGMNLRINDKNTIKASASTSTLVNTEEVNVSNFNSESVGCEEDVSETKAKGARVCFYICCIKIFFVIIANSLFGMSSYFTQSEKFY